MMSFLLILLLINSLNANLTSDSTSTSIIIQTVILNINSEQAFEYFTIDSKLEEWLTNKADVEPVIGGKYELFWDPETPDDNSTIGCKILALDTPNYIMFDWKGPVQFKSFMNDTDPLTQVTVLFESLEGATKVTLIHSGWRNTEKWNEARIYFENAWSGALQNLAEKVNT